MKVLLDENLPHELRHFIPEHGVFTVAYMGWSGVGNGELLVRAAAHGFDVLVTQDAAMQYQQNTAALPVAVLALGAASNAIEDLVPLVPALLEALGTLKPNCFTSLSRS